MGGGKWGVRTTTEARDGMPRGLGGTRVKGKENGGRKGGEGEVTEGAENRKGRGRVQQGRRGCRTVRSNMRRGAALGEPPREKRGVWDRGICVEPLGYMCMWGWDTGVAVDGEGVVFLGQLIDTFSMTLHIG